ncbi:MAG: aminoglycoside phosphotransferase family protein [Acetobacteraceae bacterium]|nr:aminoglycoside phosphotransferase family protein [Acetobacteraceae bacterium]
MADWAGTIEVAADGRLAALYRGLRAALRAEPATAALAGMPMAALRDKGLAHDHIRLGESGWLARVPKQSQMDLPAAANLAYQAACFRRAAPGGHVPRLLAVLPPGPLLAHGALVVEAIAGRPARLPGDLPAVARALASLHALPRPAATAPLLAPADPLAAMRDEVAAQGAHLAEARLDRTVRALVEREMTALLALCAAPARPATCLISFDAHPGNFLVRADGSAVLVDLEKGRYGAPSLDLAHATLYTSTTWDLDSEAELTVAEIAAFHAAWEAVPGVPDATGWHGALRRAMWLWSVTWCAKWRVLSAAPKRMSADGEDWSAEASDRALIDHVRGRVDHYLSPAVVARCLDEFSALERVLAG